MESKLKACCANCTYKTSEERFGFVCCGICAIELTVKASHYCDCYEGNGITPPQEIEELKMKNEKLRARIKHLEEVEDAYNELAMEEDWEDERQERNRN